MAINACSTELYDLIMILFTFVEANGTQLNKVSEQQLLYVP
jgi:hypothetical protein